MVPGGMRIGTPALTTRGLKEAEFVQVANFIDRAVKIAKDCQQKTPAPGEVFTACCADKVAFCSQSPHHVIVGYMLETGRFGFTHAMQNHTHTTPIPHA